MRHWSLESDHATLQTEASLAVVGQYTNLTAVNPCNIKSLLINRVWWHSPKIPIQWRCRQKDWTFRSIFGYKVILRPAWDITDFVLKTIKLFLCQKSLRNNQCFVLGGWVRNGHAFWPMICLGVPHIWKWFLSVLSPEFFPQKMGHGVFWDSWLVDSYLYSKEGLWFSSSASL